MPSIYHFSVRRAHYVLYFIVNSVCGDFYHSATSEMVSLLRTQDKLIHEITDFIYQEYDKLSSLEHYLMLLKKDRSKALRNVKAYLDNPVNTFTLIKRLTVDVDFVESRLHNSPAFERDRREYPDMNDLSGAVAGLERLRRTYLLNITEMANGSLNGTKSEPMLIADCFDLAIVLYEEKQYNASIAWLAQALLKYSLGEPLYPATLKDILMGLGRCYEGLGDEKNTQLWKQQLAMMYTQNQFQGYREMAENLIKMSSLSPSLQAYPNNDRLCRGETNVSTEVQSKLKCFYSTNNPSLKLAPFKFEQLHKHPDIIMVHDAMNNNEIQYFIDKAKPKMKPAAEDVQSDKFVKYRTAKIAWFTPTFSKITDRVSKRMSDMSGFDLAEAEALQVANYGIGGHYAAHLDYFKNDSLLKSKLKDSGNRYGTILIYLSDVSSGGATVFLKLGVTVPPKKGAAIFWRNLLPTGRGNPKTLHAACPVLLGNKWVLNRWVREVGQELKSLCTSD